MLAWRGPILCTAEMSPFSASTFLHYIICVVEHGIDIRTIYIVWTAWVSICTADRGGSPCLSTWRSFQTSQNKVHDIISATRGKRVRCVRYATAFATKFRGELLIITFLGNMSSGVPTGNGKLSKFEFSWLAYESGLLMSTCELICGNTCLLKYPQI